MAIYHHGACTNWNFNISRKADFSVPLACVSLFFVKVQGFKHLKSEVPIVSLYHKLPRSVFMHVSGWMLLFILSPMFISVTNSLEILRNNRIPQQAPNNQPSSVFLEIRPPYRAYDHKQCCCSIASFNA